MRIHSISRFLQSILFFAISMFLAGGVIRVDERFAYPLRKDAENVSVAEDLQRYIYVKTNLPAWLCLWTNIAVEIDVAPHFSTTLPIYYSGLDYFRHSLKFRIFAIQPEFRFWPRSENHGFFTGMHFGLAYYNVALNGEYRYQDHNASTPALGGGVAVGWRFRLNKDPDLSMEATLGGGIYRLDYDIFFNKGISMLAGRRKRTFYGVDQVALSITYRFGVGNYRSASDKRKGEADR